MNGRSASSGRHKITAEVLARIKESVSLAEIVGEHVVLRKSGANHSGLCPFHSERTPSFSVNDSKGLYHCYGCKKSGDIVTFVMEIHALSFPEAVEELAERAKVALPRDWGGASSNEDPVLQKKRQEQREKLHLLYKLNLFAMAFYRHQLKQSPGFLNYFSKRGVSGELADQFRVGAALPQWDLLARHLIEKKAPLPLAVELGLIRPSTQSAPQSVGYFDLFRNRALFPLIDMRGRVAGFGGRWIPTGGEESAGEVGPKYMNSPESLVFQKSKLAFGLFQAQKYIRELDELILVEGYFDVAALHAAGFKNAVATCGTSLTPDHLQLFKKFAKKIILLFDGDQAGITATQRAMEVGLERGQVLFGATLPPQMDPDEILFDQQTGALRKGGADELAGILSQARPLLASAIEHEAQLAGKGPEALTQGVKRVSGWLTSYTDPVGRAVWVQEALKHLPVSRSLLAQAMGEKWTPGAPQSSGPVIQSSRPTAAQSPRPLPGSVRGQKPQLPARMSSLDRALLQTLALPEKFAPTIRECLAQLPKDSTVAELLEYPPAQSAAQKFFPDLEAIENFWKAPQSALMAFQAEGIDSEILSCMMESIVNASASWEESVCRASWTRSVARVWARFSHRIKELLTQAESKQDTELHSKLMKDYLDLQRKIKEFNNFYDEA